jgi:citrate lyase subunit beta/citryl-CoA lyase
MVMEEVRTLLFAPGNARQKLERALRGEADGVICDLEDSVPAAEKTAARATTRAVLTELPSTCARLIRVNATEPELEADLAMAGETPIDALVVPKATPELLASVSWGGLPLIAIVETAAGLRRAYDVARAPGVKALMLGTVDLGAELGLVAEPDGRELLFARSSLVVDSAAAGIRPPFDGVHLTLEDDAGLEEEATRSRSLGFAGKACIHPRQVPIANRVFAPSETALAWARDVVEGYEEALDRGRGVVRVNGEMVDRPVVERARRMLAHVDGVSA